MRNQNWYFSLSAALLLMCPFDLLASLAMDMYLPAVPDMPGLLGSTPARVQLTLSCYMVLIGGGQLAFGPLSDRFGRRPVLLGGAAAFALSSLGLALARSFVPFMLLRVLEACGGAAMLVATFATVRDVYATREGGGTVYAVMGSILAFVPALGPLAGASLYEAGGLSAVFLCLSGLSAAAGLRALYLWPETRPEGGERVRLRHVGVVLKSREFLTYTLGYSVAMGAFFVYFSTAPGVLVGRHGYTPLGFSAAFATVALVMIVASRFAGRLVKRYGRRGCLARGMALIFAGASLLVGHETVPGGAAGFLLPAWVIGVGVATTAAVAAEGALSPFSKIAGTATALYYCLSSALLVCAGTAAVVWLPGQSAWPLIAYAGLGSAFAFVLCLRGGKNT